MSQISKGSRKTAKTALELQEFFKKGEEDIKSKVSQMTKGSQNKKFNFKEKLYHKLERQPVDK